MSKRGEWLKLVVFRMLPVVALLLGALAGFLKWHDASGRGAQIAAVDSVAAAGDTAVAILSYGADTAEKDLNDARGRLTGAFLEEYTKLINTVVIPGAKQKKISAVAKVSAAGSVSATADHAVVMVFVDQTTTIGNDAPTASASSVRVTLDHIGGRWLVSGFEPV